MIHWLNFVTENGEVVCTCGENNYEMKIDTGNAGNWPLFPLKAVRFGDTGAPLEYIDFKIGPLICEQGRWNKIVEISFAATFLQIHSIALIMAFIFIFIPPVIKTCHNFIT